MQLLSDFERGFFKDSTWLEDQIFHALEALKSDVLVNGADTQPAVPQPTPIAFAGTETAQYGPRAGGGSQLADFDAAAFCQKLRSVSRSERRSLPETILSGSSYRWSSPWLPCIIQGITHRHRRFSCWCHVNSIVGRKRRNLRSGVR